MTLWVTALLASVSAGTYGCASAGRAGAGGSGADDLVGTWRLVAFDSRTANGQTHYPLGRQPKGQLQYDAMGRMSAQLMDPDRPRFTSGDLTRGSDPEVRAALAGYIAYYGTYTSTSPTVS